MAVGPQLAGIQLNDGSLLAEGQVRNIAPADLTFRFSQAVDTSTLSGIRITRAGLDGQFDVATATTDFNTNGLVAMDFSAKDSGLTGDGISLQFIKNPLGAGLGPKITVQGKSITVELNTTTGSETRAGQLRDALNADVNVSKLLTASIRSGGSLTTNIAAPAITYSPVTLLGSSTPSIASSFNVGRTLEIEFIAQQSGDAGQNIEIAVTKRDKGGVSPPTVTVKDKVISVELNSNSASPTTAQELVDAINANTQARALVKARLNVGSPTTAIGNRTINYSPLRLAAVNDVIIEPGYLGVGASANEIVMRFKEPLPDDLYHVEIIGTGANALRGINGSSFGDRTEDGVNNGVDFDVNFGLDLGAKVLAVVPQPITRNNNTLSQARNQVVVYFNNDDLYATRVSTGQLSPNPTVVDPAFYQLIFTQDTVQNTDDAVYRPRTIQYDPATDIAVLTFDRALEELGSGAGTFRLRVGTDESVPLAPVSQTVAAAQATSSFNTAGAVVVSFTATSDFASSVAVEIRKRDQGAAGAPVVSVVGQRIVVELNTNAGNATTAQQLVDAINGNAQAQTLVVAAIASGNAATNIATPATAGSVIQLAGLGSSFDTSTDLGTLGDRSQVLSAAIEPQVYDLQFPGAISEPGHRDISADIQQHYLDTLNTGDLLPGITTLYYNFQTRYGFDPEGNVLNNGISEAQKQRAREIFTLFGQYLGVQFVETENLGMTIATGDIRAVDPTLPTGKGGILGAADGGFNGLAVMDLQDFSNTGDDKFGGAWFQVAMKQVGRLLGMGYTTELPPVTVMEDEIDLSFPENTEEPIYPGANDIVHGQNLFRPEGKDIDLYKFTVSEAGRFSAETFAERLSDASLLDTVLRLYRLDSQGNRTLIAQNDDYFSNDSFLEMDLPAGTYWIGVSASGNSDYDPSIEDSGLGGRSEGAYQLRLNMRPNADNTMRDATNVELDGDADGVPGGVYETWFRAQTTARTIYVDKAAATTGNGSLSTPFRTISDALSAAESGDIVRVVGNGGADRNVSTLEDNLAYEIGFNQLGTVLADGASLDVPKGVTLMIDSGAIVKLRRADVAVGSTSTTDDRSGSALQVLGTPVLLDSTGSVIRDATGSPIPGSVYFTSIHDKKVGKDTNPDQFPPAATAGDWGGIAFRNDVDGQDQNRFSYENSGIFLNQVNFADMRYGGGIVVINGIPQVVAPIEMVDSRPTVTFNRISSSADAAMAANPNSFAETTFHESRYQFVPFTSDYNRVGPEIHGNTVTGNSLNGLFVRVTTPAGTDKQPLTVSARWDDADIPHVVAERLVVQGTPGGALLDATTPSVQITTLAPVAGGQLESGDYNYRLVYLDASGNESLPSNFTATATIDATTGVRSIKLDNLPTAPQGFVGRRIYRSDNTANPAGDYLLVAELNASSISYLDTGTSLGQTLAANGFLSLRPRLDARLAIDPGVVVKIYGGVIETTFGADLYAEGRDGAEVVMTSIRDNRYGGGGTFETATESTQTVAAPGDWGGLFIGPATRASIDNAVIAYGGGEANIEGTFATFNAVEVHQAQARITNSLLERNASGVGGQANDDRNGRGFNREAALFVRGAQPVVLSNTFVDNDGAAISIDANSLNYQDVQDWGRSTFGKADPANRLGIEDEGIGNQGPFVRYNSLDRNGVNGMQVRGTTLTTEGVWDDTDIVHVLRNETVYVPDQHTYGGLRLESSSTETLVVKLEGDTAGITATGRPLDIEDRIGGSVQLVGQPGHPVVLTSINDCTVGAGFTPSGEAQTDTLNTGACRINTSVAPYVDVVVLMDESASMGFAQQFSAGMITDLEAALIAAGIGSSAAGGNHYGLAGFGGDTNHELGHSHPVGPNSALFGTASEYVTATSSLTGLGAIEDGYDGIHYVLNNYPFRADAERFIILGSNEDRDSVSTQYVFANTLAALNLADVTLETIIDATIYDSAGNQALAIDANRNAYVDDGAGGFTVSPNGTIPPNFYDTSVQDYADMAFSTGGTAGDIYQIQAGGQTATSFSKAIVSQITSQAGAGLRGQPGDWQSVLLDQYSNDRNVDVVVEMEASKIAAPGTNATVQQAEYLGKLAVNEKSGDDNLRLGFEVQGALSARNDLDVYSFTATAGTEVWFDIDQTSTKLDTVLELLDTNGRVLARSNDSGAEAANPSLLYRSASMTAGTVNPLRKSGYDPQNPGRASDIETPDYYTTNPRDAGMRVVLPGTPGTSATYHVRVRSAGDNLDSLTGGKTSGRYQLQVRLRELDEAPGSTVRYADIRFATNGIEILGQPGHSPLLGEATEIATPNNALVSAQDLGNLLQTDRGVISLAGDLALPSDVDFYKLTIAYDSIDETGYRPYLSTVFDMDYADGLARANTELWVFDSTGKLILRGGASNIADDRSGPLKGTDMADLSRGSVGAADPYIGPVEMPAGPDDLSAGTSRQTYYIAISSNAQLPDELRQYLEANAPNPYVRLEPISSVQRIADDRVGSYGTGSGSSTPTVPVLMDTTKSAVPFNLGDVTLFVTTNGGLAPSTSSTLRTVDPFTGRQETVAGSFAEPIGDVAMRGDGNLFAYSLGPDNWAGAINDTSTGAYVRIDTGTGASTKVSANSDNVETNVEDPANPGTAERAPVGTNNDGVGISYNAIAYRTTTNSQYYNGFAVGTRNDSSGNNDFYTYGLDYLENILYQFDITSGAVASSNPGAADRTGAGLLTGAGTQKIEFGEIVTYTRIFPQAPEVGDTFTLTINGKSISYTATGGGAGVATVAEVVSGLATAWANAALTVPEFAAYQILNYGSQAELRVRLTNPSAAMFDIVATTTDGGAGLGVAEDLVVMGGGPGGTVTGMDWVNDQLYAVTDRGGLYEVSLSPQFVGGSYFVSYSNLGTYVRSSAIDLMTADNGKAIQFAGLTAGPENVEDGRYADMLFGISTTGELYAFNTAGELQPVFMNGETSVDTGLYGVTGLAFSTLDRNLWTVTTNRGSDVGHGLNGPGSSYASYDGSDIEVNGGASFYFGNDTSTNTGGNQSYSNSGSIRNYNFPGGAYGSLVSNPFSLQGYASEDRPYLYFNYFLESENTNYNPATSPTTPTRDSFRVFVSGDNGEWTLVATNDTFQSATQQDEFDIGQNDTQCLYPGLAGEPCVQQIFDNTNTWRQARISLAPFAGMENLRIRFDFSTAGAMNVGDQFTVGSELRAIGGAELRDGQVFVLDGSDRYEFDLGYTFVAPNGAAINDGDSFIVSDGVHTPVRFEFDNDNVVTPGSQRVPFSIDDSASDVGSSMENAMHLAFAPIVLTGDLMTEVNDTLADAVAVRTVASSAATFSTNGEIGDNTALSAKVAGWSSGVTVDYSGADVDFTKLQLNAGETLSVKVSAATDSTLLPAVRLFNSLGQELASSGSVATTSTGATAAATIQFDVLTTGTYYVAVSSTSNVAYNAAFDGSADIQLQIPSQGGTVGGITDGERFSIDDGSGSPATVFEFDSDGRLVSPGAVPISLADMLLQVPSAGVGFGGIQDGYTFVVNDNQGSGDVTFEFDTNGAVGGTNIRINVAAGASATTVAGAMATALRNANIGLTPVQQGATVRLGRVNHRVDVTGSPTLSQLSLPRNQQQLAVLLADAIRNARIGLLPTMTSAGTVSLDVQAHKINATLAPHLAVGLPSDTGAYQIDVDISAARPFTVARNGDRLNLINAASVSQTGLPATFIEGAPGTPTPGNTAVVVNAGMSAAEIAQAVAAAVGRTTAGYVKQITAVSGNLIADGEIFSISDGTATKNFEFESGYSLQVPTSSSILDGEFFTVSNGATTKTFEFDNNGAVTPGSIQVRTNDLMLVVPYGGAAFGAIADGNTFTVSTAPGVDTIFEFDTNSSFVAGHVSIPIATTANQNDVANAIVQALTDAGLGLQPRNIGQGQVRLAVKTQTFDITGTPRLTQQTVLLSQDELSNKIVAAISGASLGLTPVYLGSGLVNLGGTASNSIDVSNALTLTLTGSPGLSDPTAIEIRILPTVALSATQVSTLIQNAIQGSGLNVTVSAADARRINLSTVSGHSLYTDFSQAPSLPVIDGGESVKVYENIVRIIGHTVTDQGPLGLEASLAGDSFGAYNVSGPQNVTGYPGALRGMDNAHEGLYLDDFVIGFAERGELVRGSATNASFTGNSELLNPNLPVGLVPSREIETGPYQLEIRQGATYATIVDNASIIGSATFDTNDRLATAVAIDIPAGNQIREGDTIRVSDGLHGVTLEFNDLTLNNGVTPGNVAVGYYTSDSAVTVARRVRDAINSSTVQATIAVTAALADGTVAGVQSTSSRINLFGNAVLTVEQDTKSREIDVAETNDTLVTATPTGIGTESVTTFVGSGQIGDNASLTSLDTDVDLFHVYLDAGQTLTIDIDANAFGSRLDSMVRVFDSNGRQVASNDDYSSLDSFLAFTATATGDYYIGVSGYWNLFYDPQVAESGIKDFGTFSTGEYKLRLTTAPSGLQVTETTEKGDQNVQRDQGQVLVQSSSISYSKEYGIIADAGTRDGSGNTPHLGPVRVTREVNTPRLTTGVTITNNVITRNGSGGILFSGDVAAANQQVAAVPFGRIINNTIVGLGASGIGIEVTENASPTVLNNIVAELGTGISIDATSSTTVLGGTVYQRNTTNTSGAGLGSFPIVLDTTAPLFVNSAKNTFYLADGSRAIDSSVNSLQDRPEFVAVKSPLGIGLSPILAPDLDALGQTRVDDPQVSPPPGQGSNVFKDRGALDRADFSGPSAVLIDPQDNDRSGDDTDARSSYVALTNVVMTNFSIQLVDGLEPNRSQAGSGADDGTVRGNRVTVYRDNKKLIQGVDYTFDYDSTNNIIRLTPIAGMWEVDSAYEIELSNKEGYVIATLSGNVVQDGDSFTVTDESANTVTFEYDSGFNLQVPQTLTLQIPANGGAAIRDGETFTIGDGKRTVVFEFDKNGATTTGNVAVAIGDSLSANDVAAQIVTAIKGSTLALAPTSIVNYLGRAVQLGSTALFTLDTTKTTLTQTGQAGGVEDGQTFTIDDGSKVVTFEFTDNGVVATGNQAILFSLSQTREQIADTIVTAVRNARVGLTPSHSENSDGLVHLGGTANYQVNVAKSKLALLGRPGASPAWGIQIPTIGGVPDYTRLKDGQTFVLTNGATAPVTFELDDNGQTTAGNKAISFTVNTTTAQLASAIAIAIRNANLGLTPTSSANGVVTLGGTAAYRLTMTNTALVQIGQAGVPAAIAVPFIPGSTYTPGVPVREPIFDENDMALAVRDAITSAVTSGRLVDVTATVRTDGATATTGEVVVEGASDVSGAAAVLRSSISDVAGNSLKANRNDGTTRFTIYVDRGLDFGDAPESYGTLQSANGASHQMVPGFYLGSSVDGDFDGQPTSGADGDDNDGVDDEDGVAFTSTIEAGKNASIIVTASAPGYLDAWIDYNSDGDWNDAGENVLVRQSLTAGPNNLSISVPSSAAQGTSYARFRLSSIGGLGPIGYASDGEVEDYAVTLIGNTWHNGSMPLDVNDDGSVTPLDVLLVINDLNKNGYRSLAGTTRPSGMPYLDVNGDNWVTALDALLIINDLNARAQGEGEGEFAFAANGDSAEGELGIGTGDLLTQTNIVAATTLQPSSGMWGQFLVDHRLGEGSATATTRTGDSETNPNSDVHSLASVWNTDAHNVATLVIEQQRDEIENVVDLLGENAMSIRELTASESFFADLG